MSESQKAFEQIVFFHSIESLFFECGLRDFEKDSRNAITVFIISCRVKNYYSKSVFIMINKDIEVTRIYINIFGLKKMSVIRRELQHPISYNIFRLNQN